MDVPFLHEVHHGPHDFYRFTRFALLDLAMTAGFTVVEIRPSGGYFRALAHLLEEAPSVVRSNSAATFLMRVAIVYPLKGLGWLIRKFQYLLDLQDKQQNFTSGYHCIFRKPFNE